MADNSHSCFHCGDPCDPIDVEFDDKHFCCNGCKTVFQILSESNLDLYYKLEDQPGIKPESEVGHKYDFLENETIENRLLDFHDAGIKKVRIFLPDIHCSSCIYLLENLARIESSVIHSEVNFVNKTAHISFKEDELSLKQLAVLLDRIGYEPKFDTQSEADQLKKRNRKFLFKLGLTFFCFANIMLFSFPEYLKIDQGFKDQYRHFFAYLVFVFSLPLILFSARDYIVGAFKAIRAKTTNLDVPVTIGILALYFKSVTEIFLGNGPGYMDSFAGFIFFLLLGKWFQNKTYESLSFERDYQSYFPLAVTRIKAGLEEMKPIEELEKGDIIAIRNQEIIPADCVLLSEKTRIDYSFVTGEADPITKVSGEQIFAGGRQIGERIELSVLKEVENSYLTQLWNQRSKDSEHKISGLRERTEKVSRFFIIGVIAIAVLTGIAWYFIDSSEIIDVVTAVLIVACPCALALSIPFTFGNAIRTASRNNWYFKNSDSMEYLGKVTDIVFDKTGTLTESGHSEISFSGDGLGQEEIDIIYSLVRNSNHPLSRALSEFLHKQSRSVLEVESFEEIAGKGIRAGLNSREILIGSADWIGVKKENVLGAEVHVSINGKYLGYFVFGNKYREDINPLLSELSKNYELHLLSGDNESEKEMIESIFPQGSNVLFNQSPSNKKEFVFDLRKKGKQVMMIGDGLNDAGALLESNLGIAVAEGVHSFSPACDAIVEASKLTQLNQVLDLGRFGMRILMVTYTFSILYNIVGLYFAVQGLLTPLIAAILMPLSYS